MGFAGGDPAGLSAGRGQLDAVTRALAGDAEVLAAMARREPAATGDPEIARLLETALAATGGVLLAAATVAHALAEGSSTAAEQLTTATGGR